MTDRARTLLSRSALSVLIAAASTIGLALPAVAADETPAQAENTSMPPALAEYVARTQSEVDFLACMDMQIERQGLADADLIERVAAKGLADDVYAAVSAEVDGDPDAMLRSDGFVPAHADPDKALAEKALVLARMSTERTAAGEDRSMNPFRASSRFFVAVNDAIDAGCEVPAHLLPGGDTLRAQAEAIAPLLAEAQRVNDCATSEIEARGMDDAAVFALIEKKGLSTEYRARALDIAANMPGVDETNRAKVASYENPYHLGTALSLLSAMTFELESMARATGVNAIYLDRALDGKCKPDDALKTFIGATDSADH